MNKGDQVFFYHSNEGKEIVGLAKVVKEHYQDPTTDNPAWCVVDLAPVKAFKRNITLAEIKADKKLEGIQLVKQARLSVASLTKKEFDYILKLSEK